MSRYLVFGVLFGIMALPAGVASTQTANTGPAAEPARSVEQVPADMERWFSQAVGDILQEPGEILNLPPKPTGPAGLRSKNRD